MRVVRLVELFQALLIKCACVIFDGSSFAVLMGRSCIVLCCVGVSESLFCVVKIDVLTFQTYPLLAVTVHSMLLRLWWCRLGNWQMVCVKKGGRQ